MLQNQTKFNDKAQQSICYFNNMTVLDLEAWSIFQDQKSIL